MLLSMTFVEWWIPVVGALCTAGVFLWPLRGFWRWLTGMNNRWINIIFSVVAVGCIAMCALLVINYNGATFSKQTEVKAEIVEKVRKTKHHTRRVGRRTYTTGQVYYVYELSLSLPDGRQTKIDVSLSDYNRVRTGESVGIRLATGALGWDVIDTRDIVFPTKHCPKRTITPRKGVRQASRPE